jgi:hypothetical protein
MPPGVQPPQGAPGNFPNFNPGAGKDSKAPGAKTSKQPEAEETVTLGPGTYLTLNKALSEMMNRLEDRKKNPGVVLFSSATQMDKALLDNNHPLLGNQLLWQMRQMWDVTSILTESKARIRYLGVALRQKDVPKDHQTYQLVNDLVCVHEEAAQSLEHDLLKTTAPDVAQFFKTLLKHPIDIVKETPPSSTDAEPGPASPPGSPGLAPPSAGGGRPPGQPPGGGSFTPPGQPPGGGGSFTPPGQPPGGGGNFTPPGGVGPPGGFNPFGPPGMDKGNAGEKSQEDPTESEIRVGLDEVNVTFTLNIVLDNDELKKFQAAASTVLAALQLQMEIAVQADHRDKLALAIVDLGKQGQFPAGAFERRQNKTRIAQDPVERVSWMANLLPFLGHRSIYDGIKLEKSWKDPDNWLAARAQIPEFLDPTYPARLRSVFYPGLPMEVGATHYVGMAGVGLDAPGLPNDPAYLGKLGVFGYNRSTSLEMIRKGRGLSSTIVVIQVPPNGPGGITPWMAGGGSTIRGVPEKDSIRPFVGEHQVGGELIRRKGTFVVMADGTVRFISDQISDEVFKALCTVNGPAPEFDLDKVAPRVDREPKGKGKKPAAAPAAEEQPEAPASAGVEAPPQGDTPPAAPPKKK